MNFRHVKLQLCAQFLARCNVGLMGMLVGLTQLIIFAKVLVEFLHHLGRFQGRARTDSSGAGEVESRGERRSVFKARSGCHDRGFSTRASGCNPNNAARNASQLFFKDLKIGVARRRNGAHHSSPFE